MSDRRVNLSAYAIACHDCALGLLRTAREVKRSRNTKEVVRLVNKARWYWRRFTDELFGKGEYPWHSK